MVFIYEGHARDATSGGLRVIKEAGCAQRLPQLARAVASLGDTAIVGRTRVPVGGARDIAATVNRG